MSNDASGKKGNSMCRVMDSELTCQERRRKREEGESQNNSRYTMQEVILTVDRDRREENDHQDCVDLSPKKDMVTNKVENQPYAESLRNRIERGSFDQEIWTEIWTEPTEANIASPSLKIMVSPIEPGVSYEESLRKRKANGFYDSTDRSIQADMKNEKVEASPTMNRNLLPTVNGNANQMIEGGHWNCGQFSYQDGQLVYGDKPIMNAAVVIQGVIQEEEVAFYDCLICMNQKLLHEKIEVSDFADGNWLKKIPGLVICCGKRNFQDCIFTYLNMVISNTNMTNALTEQMKSSGWHKNNGVWYYVTREGVLGMPNLRIKATAGQNFNVNEIKGDGSIRRFLGMRAVTPKSPCATIILLYTIQSFCYRLYKEAKMVPKYVLFVHGERGSFKTSLALALTQIENRDAPKFTMKSTGAGLESGFREYVDAVMLIDDLAPGQDRGEKRRLESNLDLLVRSFGDSTGKKRNNDYQKSKKDQYEVNGGAIITGEYTTGVESSLARCLFIGLSNTDVDREMLSRIQKDPSYLTAFLAKFLIYVGNNFDYFVQMIMSQAEMYRSQLSSRFSNARYAEYYAQLLCAVRMLLTYGESNGELSREECGDIEREMVDCIEFVVTNNSRSLKEENPAVRVCSAIVWAIEQGLYKICDVSTRGNDVNVILEDAEYYYIQQTQVKAMKDEYDKRNGFDSLQYKAPTLAELIVKSGVAIETQEGKTKRNARKLPGHGNIRYMQINKKRLQEISNI